MSIPDEIKTMTATKISWGIIKHEGEKEIVFIPFGATLFSNGKAVVTHDLLMTSESLDHKQLDEEAGKARSIQQLLAKLGYGVEDEHFVKGTDKIPFAKLAGHNITSFAEWLRRREDTQNG